MSETSPVAPPEVRRPRNIKLVMAYDGRGYVGWERQKNGLGIQELVEDAIERITGERTTVNGSGRTDAGVHALAQVANFTLLHPMRTEILHRALLALLPEDLSVTSVEEVDLFFHARFSAVSKTYRYSILNSRIRDPLRRHLCWRVNRPLDDAAMGRAATLLVGRHDFSAFCKEPENYESCVRTLQRLEVRRDGDWIEVEAAADGFLYNMVRILVGTLVHVGLGKIPVAAVPGLLEGGERKAAGPTVPACGLVLAGVHYPLE